MAIAHAAKTGESRTDNRIEQAARNRHEARVEGRAAAGEIKSVLK
jgi:hypothetical protein